MSTLNLLPFIATQNSLARRDETVPVYIHHKEKGLEIPVVLDNWLNKIEDYMNGIRLFGHEAGRKEDGYGERTYHFKDLEELLNVLRSIGLSKSYPDFIEDYNSGDGWDFPQLKTNLISEEGQPEKYQRTLTLEGKDFNEIYEGIKDGRYSGLDCVDFSGKLHRNCSLIKISDLHPEKVEKRRVLNEATEKYEEKDFIIPGVNSELFLIITPECAESGYVTHEGETEPTLQGSPWLRSPLGFVTMRISRLGIVTTKYPKGTAILKSLCPVNVDYHVFDSVLAKATLIINDTHIPGVIYKSIAQLNNQAFLTEEHLSHHQEVLDYILSPEEERDGIANVYKNWKKLTGQHYNFSTVLEEAQRVFNARPKIIDEAGTRVGQDLQYVLMPVMNIHFEFRWAIIEEFEVVLNPAGYRSGKSAITSANPTPYYIHTLNPVTNEWEKDPVTKWLLADSRGRRFFARGENPFQLVNVEELTVPEAKPLNDVYERIKEEHAIIEQSLKKD